MKAILEFNLPEENVEFEEATNGWRYLSALDKIRNYLREKIKYDTTLTEDEDKVYNKIYDEFFNILREFNVEL